MNPVHVVLPDNVDDPLRPSGGNVYDRRALVRLADLDWTAVEHLVPTGENLAATLGQIPDGAPVMVDGLLASWSPTAVAEQAGRLRVVVVVHLPRGQVTPEARAPERAMLHAVDAVVATSAWTRTWLVEQYGLAGHRVHLATPGTDPADLAAGSTTGASLLCVGAVIPGKGHDILVAALRTLHDAQPHREWRCAVVGSHAVDPAFAAGIVTAVERAGLTTRVEFTGPLSQATLADRYAAADVLVLPSRFETFGMVVTEALARGLPVIGTRVGGLPEALGGLDGGPLPGVLVRTEDPDALAVALSRWLDDPAHRAQLRARARDRRPTLPAWSHTAQVLAEVLAGLGAPEPFPGVARSAG